MPRKVNWTKKDLDACNRRGFGIFEGHGDGLQLCKFDDPDDWEEFHGPNFKRYRSDNAVALMVKREAAEGDRLCRKIIRYLIQENSPDVETFKLKVTW